MIDPRAQKYGKNPAVPRRFPSLGFAVVRVLTPLLLVLGLAEPARARDFNFVNCGAALSGLLKRAAGAPLSEAQVLSWFDLDPLIVDPASEGSRARSYRSYSAFAYRAGTDLPAIRRYVPNYANAVDPSAHPLIFGEPFQFRANVLGRLFGNYQAQDFAALTALLMSVEGDLYAERMDIGVVHRADGELVGSLRAYDSTPEPYVTDYRSPVELMFARRGRPLASIEALRLAHPEFRFFEMGNFLLLKPTGVGKEAALRSVRQTKAALLQMWLDKLARRFPRAYYFAHVASESHARLYALDYGFYELERVTMNDLGARKPTEEIVLYVDGSRIVGFLERKIAALRELISD